MLKPSDRRVSGNARPTHRKMTPGMGRLPLPDQNARHGKLDEITLGAAAAEALMLGVTEEEALEQLRSSGKPEDEARALAPQKAFPGNRPSLSIVMNRLTPQTLGALLALYEHKIFVQGAVWGLNSYDQFGVELGKVLAGPILAELKGEAEGDHDRSTSGLIARIKSLRAGV